MQIFGLTISDGKAFFASRHADGLHLNAAGLDPRGTNDFGSSLEDIIGDLAVLVAVPSPVTVPTGGATLQFTALGFDILGNSLDVTPTWSIVEGAPSASINSSTGVLTTGLVGEEEEITVRATVGSLTADAAVTIADVTLTSIEVSPSSWALQAGQTKAFTAIGYVGSTPVSVSPTWSKVSGVGSINASTGVFTAGTTAGTAVIRATSGAVTDDVTITVTPAAMVDISITADAAANAGERVQTFSTNGVDIYGNAITLDGTLVSWSLDPTAGSIGGPPSGLSIAITTVENNGVETVYYNDALTVTYDTFSASRTIIVAPNGEPA